MCEMIRISLTAIFFSKTKKNTYRMEVGDPHDFGTTDRWRGNEVGKERFSLKNNLKTVSCCCYYLNPVSSIACALTKSHYMIIL